MATTIKNNLGGYDTLEGKLYDLQRLIAITDQMFTEPDTDIDQVGTMVGVMSEYVNRLVEIYRHEEEPVVA